MNSMLKLALTAALSLSVSASFAASITCRGLSDNGTDISFRHTTRPDGAVKISIIESQDGEVLYKNSWSSDLTTRSPKVNGLSLQDSTGSRGEYYSQLELFGNAGSLNYEENDSGWEYSIHTAQLTCETK
ncbi:MAG: hypothetical protein JSU04_15545 [Bdellovibrionales bacterium]|nr:hypothetical protein [Bdellovibrionales bacterium]